MKRCICLTKISEDQAYCSCCKAAVRYQDLPGHDDLNKHLAKAQIGFEFEENPLRTREILSQDLYYRR